MGELLDALKQAAEKRPNPSVVEQRLRDFLGEAGWKDLTKAAVDNEITTAVIHRVITNKGFKISYSAITRIRRELCHK